MDALVNSAATLAAGWVSWFAHAAWQGAVVGLAALAVVVLRRRWSAPVRYWILLVALLKFATPPLASMPTGVFSLVSVRDSLAEPSNPPSPGLPSDGAESAQLSEPPSESSIIHPQEFVGHTPTSPMPAAARTSAQAVSAHSPLPWPAVLFLVHLSGAVLVLVLFAIRAIRLQTSWRRMEAPSRELADTARAIARKLGLRRVPTLRISYEAVVPYSAGVLHPTIVVPRNNVEQLSPDEVQAILCHELAHHRRGDLWFNLLQVLIEAAWWFHPIVWMLNRTIRSAREECCDDLLLSRKLVADVSYCSTLLHVAQAGNPRRSPGPVCVSIAADALHPLAGRIQRIMDESLPRRERPGVLAVLALLVLAAAVLPGVRAMPAISRDFASIATPVSLPLTDTKSDDARLADEGRDESPMREAKTPLLDSNYERTLRKRVLLSGRVTDGEEGPVVGATVAIGQYFDNFDAPSTAKTDNEGKYRLRNCPTGESLLTVFKVGLAPHMQTVAISTTESKFDVTLLPGRSVRVRVTDKAGQPIAKALVWPFQWPDTVILARLHRFGETDANGIWTWDWAPHRELAYMVSKTGYMLKMPDAAPSLSTQPHELTLLPELRVKVRVVDNATSRSVPAFRSILGLIRGAEAQPTQWMPPEDVESPDGQYTIRQRNLPWDACVVRIEADGYSAATSRTISADEEDVALEIRLQAAGRRQAIVQTPQGTPAARAAVLVGTESNPVELRDLQTGSPSRHVVAQTGDDGRFRFDARDDEHTVFVFAMSGLARIPGAEFNRAAEEPLTIRLKPWARVEGILRNRRAALSNELVTLRISGESPGIGWIAHAFLQTRTDRDGRFVFDRVPLETEVTAAHLVAVVAERGPILRAARSVAFKMGAGEVRTIALGGSGRTVIGRFQMKDEAWAVDWEASSCLLQPAGETAGVDAAPRLPSHFRIHGDGSFQIEEVPPGPYRVAFAFLALRPESSLPLKKDRPRGLSGLVVGDVTVPDGAAADDDQQVNLGKLPVGAVNVPAK